MKKLAVIFAVAFLFSAFAPADVSAQSKIRVRFARGANAATLRGAVKGYVYRDYVFTAKQGQRVSITLDSKYPHPEMFVRDANGENLSAGGDSWSGDIPVNGNYTIRILLPRGFARRAQSSAYKLTIKIA